MEIRDLTGRLLYSANLSGADLRGANLNGADLICASLSGADLSGANLNGADLSGANLSRANLSRANLICASLRDAIIREGVTLSTRPLRRATRSDGYEFFLWPTSEGYRVQAGCRWFSFDEAWEHWCGPNAARLGTDLGGETRDILVLFSLALDRVEGNDNG